jgi:transcriptional regulator with GAF, ATPase, and Fis domain
MSDALVEWVADDRDGGVIAASTALSRVLEEARTVAPTQTTVLIGGETGTGKGVLAHAIHTLSGRSGPFVQVNCAAIPLSLVESELMGHERGAFTGAVAQRRGRFEFANEGTIFLDEIGELPLQVQPKLLRILQEREFERVGGTRTLRTNARIIAASNRDLKAMVAARTFREDLYYRLSVFPIQLPPLRERGADIVVLARHFTRELALRMSKPVPELDERAIQRLLAYPWPGNVRELQNVIERSVILTRGAELELAALGPGVAESGPPSRGAEAALASRELDGGADQAPASRVRYTANPAPEALADVNRAHILRVLQATNWVVAGPNGAAARLKVKRSTLNFRMRKLGIVRPGAPT